MVIVAPNSQGDSGIGLKDDGTNYDISAKGKTILSVNKTNENLLIGGDLKSRETL